MLDSISVGDSVTCTAWFKLRTPERFHVLTYNLKPLPEHLLRSIRPESITTSSFARQPVGNGPFRLVKWQPTQSIEIAFFVGIAAAIIGRLATRSGAWVARTHIAPVQSLEVVRA